MEVSIAGLKKAAVLAALYNASRPLGLGFLQYDEKPMAVEDAEAILASGVRRFDYLKGRVMKVDLSRDAFEPSGYDRDNGPGMAARVVEELRASGDTNSEEIDNIHKDGTFLSVVELEPALGTETSIEEGGNTTVVNLGFGEFSDRLKPKLDDARKEVL